jgi:hypothetical protein
MKTPKQNLSKVLKGKKILFIENDRGLYNGLDFLVEYFKKAKITYDCLFQADEKPIEDVLKAISETDVIIFQTTWRTDTRKKLSNFLYESKDKKIIIEHCINDPHWYYQPDGVVHDIYFVHLSNPFL